MLKSSLDTIAEAIAKVFNLLFDSQLYPSLWSKNMLLLLHKGGDIYDPDNYRGISISSCFAKLYSLVLKERLIDATEKFDLTLLLTAFYDFLSYGGGGGDFIPHPRKQC